MALIWNCQGISKIYAGKVLFKDIDFAINDGERLGLIGPNGSGKTTLLKIVAGLEAADDGSTACRKGVCIAYLPQDSSFPPGTTLHGALEVALRKTALEDYERETRIEATLDRFGFSDPSRQAEELSGGFRKRLSLAQTLVAEPDLVLLDEPTNHLDLEGILMLEKILQDSTLSVVLISHDRYFLQNTCTRLAELNRIYAGGMLNVNGNYTDFLTQKDAFLAAQAQQQESLANKVRREIEWLRAGVKARTTKSSARIQNAEKLQAELSARRTLSATTEISIDFVTTGRKTKKLVELQKVSKSFGTRTLFRDFDFVLAAGERLGILGRNGTGKSTLLQILSKQLEPDSGVVIHADGLRVVYFDQLREQLAPDVTMRRTLAPHGDSVVYQGRSLHIASYIRTFQFRVDQLDTPVHKLSGGERARLLLARLMLQPADVLILDEPTNDLDIEALESLEESLLEFPGCIILVTHDRFLLDRISTHLLAVGEGEKITAYSDFAQWQDAASRRPAETEKRNAREVASAPGAAARGKRLSYKEQREWDAMEANIAKAEAELATAEAEANSPAIAADPTRLHLAMRELTGAQQRVEGLYARWAELEAKTK